MKQSKLKHGKLIQRIAAECHISEASVRTVLRGLEEVVTSEVAQGNTVQLIGLGHFFLKHQRVHYQFSNRDQDTETTREVINPHFTCCNTFRNKIQLLNGVTPSYCHRNKSQQDNFIKRNTRPEE